MLPEVRMARLTDAIGLHRSKKLSCWMLGYHTVRYERRTLQIPEQSHRRHFVKAKVRVHEYPDGTLAIFHGPRRLASYTADGTPHDPGAITRSAT